jgi:uncharacterized delta-60 repeat protein
MKLTPAGVPDKTFGSGGYAVLANLSNRGGVGDQGVAVGPSGEIYLAGNVHNVAGTTGGDDACVAAVTPAGALDLAFGGGAGYVLADPTASHESNFYDLAVQTLTVNGQTVSRLIAAGDTLDPTGNPTGLVSAYTLSGALDTTFGSGGSFTYANPPGGGSQFYSLALEADGSIVVGGHFAIIVDGMTVSAGMLLGHLTAGGAADTSFGPNGTGFTTPQFGRAGVSGVAIDLTDGDIVIGGRASSGNGPTQDYVARFTGPA